MGKKEQVKHMDMEQEFVALIKEHERIILKICNVYCSATEDRSDLYQDIIVQLWKSYPTFNQHAKISTWMYRIAFNTAVSRFRKQQNKPSAEELPQQLVAEPAGDEERIAHLYQAIDKLNPVEKAIILLYLDEIKYREIGEIMGISESNVGFKINQIKKKLHVKLKSVLS